MREIIISTRAQKNIAKLLEYLELKWSEKVRKEFAVKLYNAIKIIRNNPESFPKSEINSKYNKCVITKQSTIYYRYNLNQVRVLSLFDTRQNPIRIKKIK
ncbi:type II toxin-antitoxin system RelE/ParE family toxin [Flavobacterium sp.]|uniref:type II toxin-antitoxin system RelE/ParE family toxin n=1 Tax=Flavobacterium sp. TaxID=239 RepID=UPI00286C02C8|nr:type II toxin-antitoxin system RelE/ParE family toxin [Flavobacterium sp.]